MTSRAFSLARLIRNGTSGTSSTNVSNSLVTRDASGNFSAGTVTAALIGNASTASTLQTARTIAISGDVTGSATSFNGGANITISSGITAGAIVDADLNASAAIADTKLATISTAGKVSNSATTATNANTASAIVARDASGNFTAGTITAALSGNATTATTLQNARTIAISGDVTGSATSFNGSANITISAGITAGSIVDADVNASAAIADTKLATISTAGKVSNSATTATSANTASAIVARDASGNFSAGTISADLSGNATTATTLQTARTIGGVSFNGSANINLPGVNTAGNQNTTGSAASLTTGRTIALTGDVTYTSGSFNGTANVTGTATLASVGTAGTYTKVTTDAKGRVTSGTTLAATDIPDLDAAKITSGTIDAARLPSYVDDVLEYANLAGFPATGETGKLYVALDTNKVYRWSGSTYIYITSGAVDSVAGKTGVVTLVKGDVGLGNVDNTADASKSVASAATLTTARNIGGVSFNGSANINLPGVNTAGNQNTTGSAATLTTARSIALSGAATGTATNFNGSANITIPVTALNASNLSAGTVPDARLSGTYSGFTHKIDGANSIFTTPNTGSTNTSARTVYGLAEYRSASSAQVGALVFIAPNTTSTIMHQLQISGMLYNQNIVSMEVQGYRTTGAWSDVRKISTGTVDVQTRWAVTPDGKNCLILGDVATSWSYPHFSIIRAMFSHTNAADAYCFGWTVAVVTDLSLYTQLTSTITDSTMVGSISGNAATATTLQTARTIGGVSFNGSANINLPGVNTAGNQNTTGSAATLTTARTIGGVSFNGSANINLPGVNTTGNQNTTGSAATLTTARTIAISGDVTGSATSFNGGANITISAGITAGSIVSADFSSATSLIIYNSAGTALKRIYSPGS